MNAKSRAVIIGLLVCTHPGAWAQDSEVQDSKAAEPSAAATLETRPGSEFVTTPADPEFWQNDQFKAVFDKDFSALKVFLEKEQTAQLPVDVPASLPVEMFEQNGKFFFRAVVTLKKTPELEDLMLSALKRALLMKSKPQGADSVSYALPIEATENDFEWVRISVRGTVNKSRFRMRFAQYDLYRLGPPKPKLNSVSVGIGLTRINYDETGLETPFSQWGITPKVSYDRIFSPYWIAGVNSFITALPFSSSLSGTVMRYFGANIRGGFQYPFKQIPLQIQILAGFYYTTTWVTDTAFGFNGLTWLQFYPAVSYNLPGFWGTLGGYAKFAGSLPWAYDRREFACGVWYQSRKFGNDLWALTAGFDWSSIVLNFTTPVTSAVLSSVYNVSTGVKFWF